MFRFSSNKPNSSLMITIYSISSWLKLTTVYRSLRIAMGFYAISKIESYEMKWLLFYCYIDEMCGWQFDNNANVHLILVQVHTIYRFKPKWRLTPKLTFLNGWKNLPQYFNAGQSHAKRRYSVKCAQNICATGLNLN